MVFDFRFNKWVDGSIWGMHSYTIVALGYQRIAQMEAIR
jgi:hypothetical protein